MNENKSNAIIKITSIFSKKHKEKNEKHKDIQHCKKCLESKEGKGFLDFNERVVKAAVLLSQKGVCSTCLKVKTCYDLGQAYLISKSFDLLFLPIDLELLKKYKVNLIRGDKNVLEYLLNEPKDFNTIEKETIAFLNLLLFGQESFKSFDFNNCSSTNLFFDKKSKYEDFKDSIIKHCDKDKTNKLFIFDKKQLTKNTKDDLVLALKETQKGERFFFNSLNQVKKDIISKLQDEDGLSIHDMSLLIVLTNIFETINSQSFDDCTEHKYPNKIYFVVDGFSIRSINKESEIWNEFLLIVRILRKYKMVLTFIDHDCMNTI